MDWQETARDQHGLITRAQLTECGVGEDAIEWLLRSGKVERVHRGVYVLPGVPDSWARWALAALLRAGPEAALSHRSAAEAHELEGIELVSRISIVVPEEHRVRVPGVKVHRTRVRLPTMISNGLRVTSLARTFVDLAEVVTERELETALDHAVRRRKEVSWLFRYLDELKQAKRPGLSRLRALAKLRGDGAMDSPLEVNVWRALREHDVPAFTKRHIVRDRSGYVMRVDFAWPERKVALHADSARFHLAPKQMERDAKQRARLQDLGWRQLVVVTSMLGQKEWIERLKRLLTEGPP